MTGVFGRENIVDMVTVSTAPAKSCHRHRFHQMTGPGWFRSLNS